MYAVFVVCLVALLGNCAAAGVPNRSTDGGQQTSIKFVPYLVQLRTAEGKFFCAGTLIAPQYVLTADSCFQMGYQHKLLVAVGGATTTTEAGVQRKVIDLVTTHEADVAVLKLDEPMVGDNIETLELSSVAIGSKDLVQVPGWGHGGEQPLSDDLRTARFPLVSREKCANDYSVIKDLKIFCASAGICSGDLGSPAVNRGKLVGILVEPKACAASDASLAFTHISEVRSFIESAME